jgi:hypothetical protein
MIYDLWDVESGNIINTYETEASALAVVRDLVAANGEGIIEALSLGYEADDGSGGLVAEGRGLWVRAQAAAGAPAAPEVAG